MSPRELALVTDDRDLMGDESGPSMEQMDADLMFQMRTSIAVSKLEKRIALIEGRLRTLESLESITKRHGR